MHVHAHKKTFQAGAAIAVGLRVILTSGKLAAAGVSDLDLGVLEEASAADLDYRAVHLRNAEGTLPYIANGAITAGNPVYAAASGKVAATGAVYLGIACNTTSADGDIVEVLCRDNPNGQTPLVTEHHTAGDTLLAAENGSIHTNVGASGAITIVLPAATVGLNFGFYVGAAQELRIDPAGTETIALPSTGVQGAAGKYLTADAVGEHVRLVCLTAGTWHAWPYAGTWTAEA